MSLDVSWRLNLCLLGPDPMEKNRGLYFALTNWRLPKKTFVCVKAVITKNSNDVSATDVLCSNYPAPILINLNVNLKRFSSFQTCGVRAPALTGQTFHLTVYRLGQNFWFSSPSLTRQVSIYPFMHLLSLHKYSCSLTTIRCTCIQPYFKCLLAFLIASNAL